MERDERKDDSKEGRRIKEAMKYPYCRNPLKPVIWRKNSRGEIRSYTDKGGLLETSNN
jgi:hypothetical protein